MELPLNISQLLSKTLLQTLARNAYNLSFWLKQTKSSGLHEPYGIMIHLADNHSKALLDLPEEFDRPAAMEIIRAILGMASEIKVDDIEEPLRMTPELISRLLCPGVGNEFKSSDLIPPWPFYHRHTTTPNRTGPGVSIVDRHLPSSRMNVSDITLTANYPETGYRLNKESEMVVRILEGSVTVTYEHVVILGIPGEFETVTLNPGDVVCIGAGVRYRWEPKPIVLMVVISNPPWELRQHQSAQ